MGKKKPPAGPAEAAKKAKRIARNVVGTVKPARAIEPDASKKKPKHKKDWLREES
jgi:hypothetical protein